MQFLDSEKLHYVSGGCISIERIQHFTSEYLAMSECTLNDRIIELKMLLFSCISAHPMMRPINYS